MANQKIGDSNMFLFPIFIVVSNKSKDAFKKDSFAPKKAPTIIPETERGNVRKRAAFM